MKKQAFTNGSLKETPEVLPKDNFLERLENITSVTDFYSKKEEILKRLKQAQSAGE